MKKNLVKDLPMKKDLKAFYNLNPSKEYIVKKIHYSKSMIMLDCEMKIFEYHLIASFYQELNFVHFKNGTFSLIIRNKFYPHIIKNVAENLEYIKTLKSKP